MTTIEKKLIAFVEKNIFVLAALLLTAIAFLLRRQGIWYHSQDYIHYFDMHEGNIQSAFYWLIVRLAGYGFEIPMHGIKWLAGIADFGVALFVALLCKREWKEQNAYHVHGKLKVLLLYAGCLFAPVMYIRGCIWAQVDSVAILLLLAALYLLESKNPAAGIGAILLAGLGIAVYPCMVVAVLAYFCCGKRWAKYQNVIAFALTILVAVVWSGVCGLLISRSWGFGVNSLVQWLTYHPYTGEVYAAPTEWLWQMLLLGGYGLALYSGVQAFRRKLSYVWAIVIQVIVAICYGKLLGW